MSITSKLFSFFQSFGSKGNRFIIQTALFFLLIQNVAFWKKLFELHPIQSFHDALFTLSIVCFLLCALTVVFGVFCWKFTTKVFISFCLLASAATNYYALRYGIYMDKTMIANVMQTTPAEARDLITWRYVLWMFVFGILPCIWIWRTNLRSGDIWWRYILKRLGLIVAALAILLATGLPFYKDYASLVRNHREIVKLITPSNYFTGLISYTKQQIAKNRKLELIAQDAKLVNTTGKKNLVIMVVGETSRAQNFSLNGYARETNPQLKQHQHLINFEHVSSCGTATAVSVPCMFSKMNRSNFSSSTASAQENILDILQKVGIYTYWRENDSGCKGVCDRIPHQDLSLVLNQPRADEGLFFDDLLLTKLDEQVRENQNTMLVLHSNGSHGPAYYQRYRHDLKGLFSPSCDTKEIESCDQQALINAYDNTIIGIDDMLNKTIQFLKRYENRYNIVLLYVSDHGESLGEDGLYLHGAPYMIAPKEQTHIPMIFWANEGFYQDNHINMTCLREQARTQEFSHDNIFHSLLGLWNIQTKEYQADLDVFHQCRQ